MIIQLHDDNAHLKFAPLSLTRPIGELRVGIFTNSERWKIGVPNCEISYHTESYLSYKYNSVGMPDIVVNARFIPSKSQMQKVISLGENEVLISENQWLAKKGNGSINVEIEASEVLFLNERWELFQKNGTAINSDFELVTEGRTSQELSDTNKLIGDKNLLFIEPGAHVECTSLNTTDGPIYIGENSEIMEGSMVRGPLAMCESSTLKLGTKVYGPTTLGPHCKVGGEVNNVIFQSFSNKGHDGFLGNALIGEWCNIGADTNASNLKNNYGEISVYSYEQEMNIPTNTQFMGLCMGDHSKCGINTMFNTATVVGVSCNVFGAEFPQTFIPSFSWGAKDLVEFKFEKAIEYANNMMARRKMQLSQQEISILRFLSDNK